MGFRPPSSSADVVEFDIAAAVRRICRLTGDTPLDVLHDAVMLHEDAVKAKPAPREGVS